MARKKQKPLMTYKKHKGKEEISNDAERKKRARPSLATITKIMVIIKYGISIYILLKGL